MPDAVIAHIDLAPVQFRQQLTPGDIRLLRKPLMDPLGLGCKRKRLLAPIGSAAGLPVCLTRAAQRMVVEMLTWKRLAAARRLRPEPIAATTRLCRSSE